MAHFRIETNNFRACFGTVSWFAMASVQVLNNFALYKKKRDSIVKIPFNLLFVSSYTQYTQILNILISFFRKFFVKSALPIDEELRKEIGRNIKSSQFLEPPITLFDEAQAKVEQLISETTYPNFLKSDMYLQCLEVN